MDELSKEMTLDMIQEGVWKQVAEAIGVDNLCRMLKIVGGATIYIPKLETVVRPVRDAHIKAEFNGYNYVELGLKYNVSERWVRQLCGPGKIEGQASLFDDLPLEYFGT